MRISFDFDGVLSLTPFGRLAVKSPHVRVADLPEQFEQFYDAPFRASPLRLAVEAARFSWRRMDPEAAPLLRELSQHHELLIVTGRSQHGEAIVRRWLRREKLEPCVTAVRMAPRGLRPSQHKLAIARILAVDVHIDDDPRTAWYMASHGVPRVFLLDHARALGDVDRPPNLSVVHSLREFRDAIVALDAPSSQSGGNTPETRA